MLRQRVLSAVVLIPAVAVAVYLGGPWLAAVVGLATLSAGGEFYALLRRAGYVPSTPAGLLFIALLLLTSYQPEWELTQPMVTGAVILTLIW